MFRNVFLLCLFSFLISCSKAGDGGKNTLVISPKHHDNPIKGAIAYIKFNSKEFPGSDPSKYDMVVIGENKEDHIHIESLKKGQYYIYCVGYDSTIQQIVKGGIPHKIKSKSGETSISVPITEGD